MGSASSAYRMIYLDVDGRSQKVILARVTRNSHHMHGIDCADYRMHCFSKVKSSFIICSFMFMFIMALFCKLKELNTVIAVKLVCCV